MEYGVLDDQEQRREFGELAGSSVQGAWNVKISGDDVISGPATVFRAAYRYWHKMPALGLTAPIWVGK